MHLLQESPQLAEWYGEAANVYGKALNLQTTKWLLAGAVDIASPTFRLYKPDRQKLVQNIFLHRIQHLVLNVFHKLRNHVREITEKVSVQKRLMQHLILNLLAQATRQHLIQKVILNLMQHLLVNQIPKILQKSHTRRNFLKRFSS